MSNSLDPGDKFGRPAAEAEFGAAAEFAAAWESAAHPPEIADYLPDAQTLRLGALLELIRVDLRQRWLRRPTGHRAADQASGPASPKRLYDYCSEFPELTPESIPVNLVYEEFVIRRHSGERVDPRDCLRDYPGQAAQLRGLLNADYEDQSTRRPGLAAVEGSGTWSEATRTTSDFGTSFSADGLDRIEIGQHIDDFDLLTELGSGAFARVFLARQRSMRRLVAVKISADHGSEPQTLAQLDHDYIVRVYDQRLLHDAAAEQGALRLLYMQFLPGGTLLNVLRWVRATPPDERSGRLLLDAVDAAMEEKGEIRLTDSSVRDEISALSWPETVAWLGRRLAEALGYAAANGVLHRDVKPANILLTAEAVPKFADFNISYNRGLEDSSPASYFGGSLSYMSPEQLAACHTEYDCDAADLDTRSDIYSLAVVLWELLTGEKPFDDPAAAAEGRTESETLQAMLDLREHGIDEAALRRLPPDCPAALCRVLLTCLEPDPERRWSDGYLLAKQFELCLDPIARDLVDPPEHSWRRRLRPWPWPLAIVALAIIVPNALASIYNIYYNEMQVINLLPDSPRKQFAVITTAVNGTLFPLGTVIFVYLCRHVITVLRGLEAGRAYGEDTLRRARRDLLRVGERAVYVAFSLWVLSGTVFVVGLWLTAGGIPGWSAAHLIASHVLCGAIATAYPFFLITFYAVRCVYPMFLHRGHVSEEDVVWLRRLNTHSSLSVAIAAAVPLVTIASVTFIPLSEIAGVIVPVRLLSLGCIIAFAGVYAMFRSLEDDLKALVRVTDPRLR